MQPLCRSLGDPYFEPMWGELNRRTAIVFIHPVAPICCSNLNYGAPANMNEFDFDDTRTITSLIANGVLFRYPDIRFIAVHSGGTIPVLSNRMQDRYPNDPERRKYSPNGVRAELRKVYYDVAHATFPRPFGALSKLADPAHILFGTDYSPEPIETTVNETPRLGLSPQMVQMIRRGNAEKLFPRFKL
jgi:predicted TIM-barrel fold metal-dependent hydrolase